MIDPNVVFGATKRESIEVSKLKNYFEVYMDNVDQIEIEWRHLLVSLNDQQVKALKTLPIDEMWHKIYNMRDFENHYSFRNIGAIAKIILTLPHSNAEAERIFSISTDVKNKKRNRIGSEVLNALCVVRSALQTNNGNCFEFNVTD